MAPPTGLTPTKFQLDRPGRTLNVRWSDGAGFAYPWSLLRSRCPSASETAARKEEAANPLAVMRTAPSSELTDLRLVGNYAVSFTWGDGHSHGIFTWPFLRELAGEPGVRPLD